MSRLATLISRIRARRAHVPEVVGDTPAATEQEVFTEGDTLYDAMLRDIAGARSSVRFETYIFVDDEIGRQFLAAFADRARNGVSVVVRCDHAGSWFGIGRAAIAALRATGAKFEWSRRWNWRRPFAIQKRNHRKLLIVDGALAYLGGFNIHRESSRRCVGAARWRDTQVRIRGPVVADAIQAFDRYGRAGHGWLPVTRADCYLVPSRSHVCRVFLGRVLNDRCIAARERIWATTPYYVPDRKMQHRLCRAARRGVDVRLLVPRKSDVRLAQWATRAAYTPLLDAGVRVFEYLPRVLHAKTLVIDHDWATVGTANLDFRSFFLNDEINLIAIGPALNARLATDWEIDIAQSGEVDIRPWKRRPWTSLVAESVGWMARRWL